MQAKILVIESESSPINRILSNQMSFQYEVLPVAGCIFAVVDAYDSLVSDRQYRKAWTTEKALEQIRKESGTHLDAAIVDVFLQLME